MTRERSNSQQISTPKSPSLSISLAKKKLQQNILDDLTTSNEISSSPNENATGNSSPMRRHSFSSVNPPEMYSQTKFRKKVELNIETTMERRKLRLASLSHGTPQPSEEDSERISNTARMLHGSDRIPAYDTNNEDVHGSQTSQSDPSTAKNDEDPLVGQVVMDKNAIELSDTELKALEERQTLLQDLSQWVTKLQNVSMEAEATESSENGTENTPLTDYHPDIFSNRADLTPIRTNIARRHSSIVTIGNEDVRSIPGSPGSFVSILRASESPSGRFSVPGTPSDAPPWGHRQSTAADILKPQVMTLSHGDDYDENDPSNLLGKAMKRAWETINEFETILDSDILSSITDLSDLIDDFMASNLINFSLKLRNLFYKIEEVDDINARRTYDERKFILQLLDIADEEEKYKARQFLNEQNKGANVQGTPQLTAEDISMRSLQRKIRRERSVWNKQDKEAKELESNQLHKETMTNIDSSFIDHLQKEILNLQRECIHRKHIMEDFSVRSQIEMQKAINAMRQEYEAEKETATDEFGVQCNIEIHPTEKVVIKEVDNSLKSFTKNLESMFSSISMEDMSPQMRSHVKSLIHLLVNENQMQMELKELDKVAKKSQHRSIQDKGGSSRNNSSTGNMKVHIKDANGKSEEKSPGVDESPLTEKDFQVETIGASTKMDVNILRRVKTGGTNDLPQLVNLNVAEVSKKSSPRRRDSVPIRPAKSQSQPKEKHRRNSVDDPRPTPSKIKLKLTTVQEFKMSDTPEKWAKRREEIIRRRYENMKKILKCFYTIVFVGNMTGFFKSLWDEEDEPLMLPKPNKSSHHFYPEYTGRVGFEQLMNSTVRQVPKLNEAPPNFDPLPHLDESFGLNPNRLSKQRNKTRISSPSMSVYNFATPTKPQNDNLSSHRLMRSPRR